MHAFSLSVKVPVTLSGAEVKAAIRVKRLFVSHLGLLGCLVLGILLAIVALAPTWPLVLERLEFHKEKMVKIDTGSQHHLNLHLNCMLHVLHTGRGALL